MKHLLRQPTFVVGIFILVLIVLFDAVATFFGNLNPHTQSTNILIPPGELPSFILGTDPLGRDMLARLVMGIRTSLLVASGAGLLATVLGTVVGLIGGCKAGWIDHFLRLSTFFILSVPQLVILILVSGSLQYRSWSLIAMVIGLVSWPRVAHMVRVQTVSLCDSEHVQLAKLNGFNDFSIITKQVIPHLFSYIFMAFVIQMTVGVLAESMLSLLGLGLQNSDVISLGTMLHDAYRYNALETHLWWIFLPPTFVITGLTFSLYMIKTALTESSNPRLRN